MPNKKGVKERTKKRKMGKGKKYMLRKTYRHMYPSTPPPIIYSLKSQKVYREQNGQVLENTEIQDEIKNGFETITGHVNNHPFRMSRRIRML
jgi:hypothetical protein